MWSISNWQSKSSLFWQFWLSYFRISGFGRCLVHLSTKRRWKFNDCMRQYSLPYWMVPCKMYENKKGASRQMVLPELFFWAKKIKFQVQNKNKNKKWNILINFVLHVIYLQKINLFWINTNYRQTESIHITLFVPPILLGAIFF